MGLTRRITDIFRRINLWLVVVAIFYIALASSEVYAIVPKILWHSLLIPYLLMILMVVDLGYQMMQASLGVVKWLKQSAGLIIWSLLTLAYGLLRLRTHADGVGYHKVFYSMLLLRGLWFYFGQMNRYQLRRYISLLLQRPAHIMVASYLVLMGMFSILLLLPIAQYGYQEQGLAALDALFIAVSALCVTGLAPIDISLTFSPVGLAIIALAVQLGGIGIALIGSIMLYVRRSVGISGRTLLAYSFSDEAVSDVGKVALKVIFTALAIEAVGALYFTYYFLTQEYDFWHALGSGLFFSISAFSNAGFSLFANGSLENIRFDFRFLWMISLLVTLGVVGFHFMFYEVNRLKRVVSKWWRRPVRHSVRSEHSSAINGTLVSISGYGSLLMMAGLFFLFYAFEHRHSLYPYTLMQQYIEAFFVPNEAKTAGFTSRDFTTLHFATQMVLLVGMFIGGASGGTAGGIKINTILVILAGMRAFITQQPLAKIGKFSISWEDVRRANILFISAVLVIVVAIIGLSLTEQYDEPFVIVWEVISALGTVGTSLNYTASLSALGKGLIIVVMIVGRMGALTLFNVAQERTFKKEPSYPLGNIYIG